LRSGTPVEKPKEPVTACITTEIPIKGAKEVGDIVSSVDKIKDDVAGQIESQIIGQLGRR
jgi:hypothetical protein